MAELFRLGASTFTTPGIVGSGTAAAGPGAHQALADTAKINIAAHRIDVLDMDPPRIEPVRVTGRMRASVPAPSCASLERSCNPLVARRLTDNVPVPGPLGPSVYVVEFVVL